MANSKLSRRSHCTLDQTEQKEGPGIDEWLARAKESSANQNQKKAGARGDSQAVHWMQNERSRVLTTSYAQSDRAALATVINLQNTLQERMDFFLLEHSRKENDPSTVTKSLPQSAACPVSRETKPSACGPVDMLSSPVQRRVCWARPITFVRRLH